MAETNALLKALICDILVICSDNFNGKPTNEIDSLSLFLQGKGSTLSYVGVQFINF